MGYHHNSAAAKDILEATGAMAEKRRQVFHAVVELFMRLPEETALQTGVCPDQVEEHTGMPQNAVSTLFTDLKQEGKLVFVRDARSPNTRFTVGWYRPEFNKDMWTTPTPGVKAEAVPPFYGLDLGTETLHGGYRTEKQRDRAMDEIVGPGGYYLRLKRSRNGIVLEPGDDTGTGVRVSV